MRSPEDTSQKSSQNSLPYKTDDQDVIRLIEAIKRKPDNEKAIKDIYNKSNFETSRKALEILGILDTRLSFSYEGKDLAVERDDSQREKLFLKFILRYPPYGHFLESVSHSSNLSTTDTESVKDYWWKHGYGSSGSNRDEGVVTFGKLVQLAGLGKFVIGRKGQPSRIEWNPNAKPLIDSVCNLEVNEQLTEEQAVDNNINPQVSVTDPSLISNNYSSSTQIPTSETTEYSVQTSHKYAAPKVIPNISINVDMSNWDIDKITAFFKGAYGLFDDHAESNSTTTCSQSFSESSDGCSNS